MKVPVGVVVLLMVAALGQRRLQAAEGSWSLASPDGKRAQCRHVARQQTFAFKNPDGAKLEVVVRAANDGAAFRYRFPGARIEFLGDGGDARSFASRRAAVGSDEIELSLRAYGGAVVRLAPR